MKYKFIIDSKKIKAILFDFDGTLVDTEPLQHAAHTEFLQRYGIKYITLEEHITQYGGKGIRPIYEDLFGTMSDEEYEKKRLQRRELYIKIVKEKGVNIINGAVSFLKTSHKKGLKLAIVTGSSTKTFKHSFENSPNGIKSAIAAGMNYFALANELPENEFKKVDPDAKIIKDFSEIRLI